MSYPQLDLQNQQGPKATIKTNRGDIQIVLFPEHAPKTVENFIELSKKGYYDGVIFHRVIPEFMIQGGDPTGTGMVVRVFMVKHLKMSFQINYSTLKGLFLWRMQAQIQTVVSSLSFKATKCLII